MRLKLTLLLKFCYRYYIINKFHNHFTAAFTVCASVNLHVHDYYGLYSHSLNMYSLVLISWLKYNILAVYLAFKISVCTTFISRPSKAGIMQYMPFSYSVKHDSSEVATVHSLCICIFNLD